VAKRIVWTEQAKADIRVIEQPIALQILKTLARYAQTGDGNTRQLQDVTPPLMRLRAQDQRVFFRRQGWLIWKSRAPTLRTGDRSSSFLRQSASTQMR
jgi:hypothetical protein